MTIPEGSMKHVIKTGALMIAVAGVASLVTALVGWMSRRSTAPLSILVKVPRSPGGPVGAETLTLETTSGNRSVGDAHQHHVEIALERDPVTPNPEETR
jgi:hypothetical protein